MKLAVSENYTTSCFLLFFILSWVLFPALLPASSVSVEQDSLPPAEVAYKGYRIEVTNLTAGKKSKNWLKVNCTLINTGREPVRLGKKNHSTSDLVIQFDESLQNSDLLVYEEWIRESILRQDIKLLAGQMRSNTALKLSTKDIFTTKGPAKPKPKAAEPIPDSPEVVLASGKKESEVSVEAASPKWDPTACPDIFLSDLKVLKKSKYSLTLAYTITNHGEGPANLLGDDALEGDNVAIRANLSSVNKTTRGSIIIGGEYVSAKEVSEYKNLLPPKQSYTGKMKLDISKMTRFTSYVVLELDIYNRILECDETNNQLAVKIE